MKGNNINFGFQSFIVVFGLAWEQLVFAHPISRFIFLPKDCSHERIAWNMFGDQRRLRIGLEFMGDYTLGLNFMSSGFVDPFSLCRESVCGTVVQPNNALL